MRRAADVSRNCRCTRADRRASDCSRRQRTFTSDPLLPAAVVATAERCTFKADIGRHERAAMKFRKLSFNAPCRRGAQRGGRTTADQRLQAALPTHSGYTVVELKSLAADFPVCRRGVGAVTATTLPWPAIS
jgi:hypothetical protein